MAIDDKPILGYGALTGIFLTEKEFKDFLIYRKKVKYMEKLKENIMGGTSITVTGGVVSPGSETYLLQQRVRELAKLHGLKDADTTLYGINREGQFVKWIPKDDIQ